MILCHGNIKSLRLGAIASSHCAVSLNFPFDISLKLVARTRISTTAITNTKQTHAAGGRHDRANSKKCRVSFPSIFVDFIETLFGQIRASVDVDASVSRSACNVMIRTF